MVDVTYTGRADYLRLPDSGALIRSGSRSEVSDADAASLDGRPDVTVHQDQDDDPAGDLDED